MIALALRLRPRRMWDGGQSVVYDYRQDGKRVDESDNSDAAQTRSCGRKIANRRSRHGSDQFLHCPACAQMTTRIAGICIGICVCFATLTLSAAAQSQLDHTDNQE